MKKLFAIMDVKASFFLDLFSERDTVSAIRSFQVGANDPKSTFNRFPDDFALFEFGVFDPSSGVVELHPAPLNLATARSLIQVAQ